MGYLTLPSPYPRTGSDQKRYTTAAISVPLARRKQMGCITHAVSWSPNGKEANYLHGPCHLGVLMRNAIKWAT